MPILIVAGLAIVFVLLYFSKKKSIWTPTHGRGERELLRICLGDQDMAIRLTLHELKRNPGFTHDQAIESAIQSYKRDS